MAPDGGTVIVLTYFLWVTMRFLGIGEYCDLGDMYYRLANAGHEVRVFIESKDSHDIFGGMIHRIDDWRGELPWIKAAGRQGAPSEFPRNDVLFVYKTYWSFIRQ